MRTIFRCIRANYLKMKRSVLIAVYVLIPFALALTFAGYFHTSNWSRTLKISAFLEMLGIIYPFLTGITLGIIAQQEYRAGQYQFLLSAVPSRVSVYIGEICFLLINSLLFCVIAVACFSLLFPFASINGCIQITGLLFLGTAPVYLIHFLCAFMFGKSASMWLGIAGSLLAAIMLTGLGDICWQYIPWAWSVRYMDFWCLSVTDRNVYLQGCHSFYGGIVINVIVVLVLFAAGIIWIKLWDGGKEND